MVHKALEEVVLSVLEQAYSPPLVLQDLYRFDVLMNIDYNGVAPDIGNHDDGKEIGHTRMVTDMGAFDIEAACLQTSKHRFYLPPKFVHVKSFLCITVRDKDLQLRFSFLVLDFRAGQITGLSVNVDTVKIFAFTKPQVVEEPVSPGLLAMPEDTEVLAYPDVIVNTSCVQIAQPFAAYELTVCHQMIDGVLPGKTDEPVYEFNPLLGIGVTPLVHHLEHDGERHTVVDDAQSKDVDVCVAELPVSPVQCKVVRAMNGNQL